MRLISRSMNILWRILAIVLMIGSAYAQSNFPACPGSDLTKWSNCAGTGTDSNGNKYVGEYKDGMANGQGTGTHPNGNKYVGEFKDGDPNGQGTFTYADGNKYVGEFRDGKRNGQGTGTFADGSKYVGEHKDGKIHGQGTLYASNGSIINQGLWADHKFIRSTQVQQANVPDLEIARLRAESEEAKRKQAELESQLRLVQQTTPSQVQTTLDMAKKKCTELGFKLATEGFGKCVLQLSR